MLKKTVFTVIGLAALLSLLCSVCASTVLNTASMENAFAQIPDQDRAFIEERYGVSPALYPAYASSLVTFLSGSGEAALLKDASGAEQPAFPDSEGRQNGHLLEVRSLLSLMVSARYWGGGGALAVLTAVYLFCHFKKRGFPGDAVLSGFAAAGMILLVLTAALAVWGLIDFSSLFVTFHRMAFPGSTLWQLNREKHLLMAMMPDAFFLTWAKKLLIALLPILCIMAMLIVAAVKFRSKKAPK